MKPKYRFQWYQEIYNNLPKILEEAGKAAKELGLDKLKNKIGLYPGSSSCPGSLPKYVLDAIIKANQIPVLPVREVEDELREVIKDIYGDEYDAAVTNTCEAALRVCFETLFAPPTLRKGDAYRARYIAPYGEDFDFMAAYGRPFPPKYKNLFIDRSCSAGELGVEGKSLPNLDSIFVRLVGTKYEVHGIKFNPVPLMTGTDAEKSIERIAEVAERHADTLAGFESIGYDTPGYGYGEKDESGVPKLKKLIGQLADKYDVPYLVDSASCLPVIGLSPKDICADIMVWSMDKAARAPISGLIVGKEEIMVPVRKSLGLGGQRHGEVSSHSKALFSLCDPGRDSVVGLTAVLKTLRDDPDKIKRPIDKYHDIITEEFSALKPSRFRDKLIITKSYTMGGTELNYERTWEDGEFGIPIFTSEDLFIKAHPIASALEEMGIYPALIYSGNIFLGPGLGTLDENAELNEEYARLGVRSLVRAVEIVCKYAGLED
ncbi:MAG: hypothetical protein E3J44_06900 [Candidatus Aminicenantes bacterium]|nr:MAG: hypothetical protein E3J44_06900 [Candidatus Aminicenantes bacterium]